MVDYARLNRSLYDGKAAEVESQIREALAEEMRRDARIAVIAAASRPHSVVVTPCRDSTIARAVPQEPAPSTATPAPSTSTPAPTTK